MGFRWTVCDYPLSQAVKERIVKALLIVTIAPHINQPEGAGGVTTENAAEKHRHGRLMRSRQLRRSGGNRIRPALLTGASGASEPRLSPK
jgi:hypothetical protein